MYLLITPAKNEEKNLPEVISNVLKQSLKPRLWIIVDDNSTDKTREIIKKYSKKYSFIKYLRSNRLKNEYDTEIGYSKVIKAGMDYFKKKAKIKNLNYNYIGVLDADIIIEKNYFNQLVQEANNIEKCGIISGLLHLNNQKDKNYGAPRGGARIYNRYFLEEINGYPITAAPDTVTNIKAKNRDWNLLKLKTVSGFQLRPPRAGIGLWYGYKSKGGGRYYLKYNPINAFLAGMYLSIKFPFYIGIAFFYGYFKSFFLKRPQTKDNEIIKHFQVDLYNNLKNRLRNNFFI